MGTTPKGKRAPCGRGASAPQPEAGAGNGVGASKPGRLCTRSGFAYVRQRGGSRAGKLCVVRAAAPLDGTPRVAIVVSRRYSLKAVRRNRARRLLREAYRRLFPELRPAWVVLIPRRWMQDAKMGEVLTELTELCGRLGLLRRPAEGSAEG